MRTRSKVRSETIDHAASDNNKKKDADKRKRKRKDDDPALGDAGDRSKRCKIQFCAEVAIASQSMASQVKSPLKKKQHSSADRERAAEGLFASSTSKNEDVHHNEADTTLSQGKTEKRLCSRHKKKGASLGGCLEGSIHREQNGSHTQRKESSGSTPTQVSQQPNSCYSRKRLNAANSRWKNLARSILSVKISPDIPGFASEDLIERSESAFVKDHLHRLTDFPDVSEQIRSVANSQNDMTQSAPKRRRKPFTAANALAADRRPVTGRMRQKVHKQQLSLLKRMKTWLTEANFPQSAKEENSNDVGEEFIMTEDERHAFAQTMVKSCQKNPNMRTVFLESVRMLTLSGLMQAAASNLLQQGPCEEAQNVMHAWADFKEQSAVTKTLPMNILNAVNQLHEKRGDLSTKLSTTNVVGICTLSQIDEQTWKFQLPGSPLEDENSLSPSVTKSLGQKDTAL